MPARGDIWLVDLHPTRDPEQAGRRPALVVSTNALNQGPAGLVVVLPITTTERRIPLHVPVLPPEGNLLRPSYVKCEDIRSITVERLVERWGAVSNATLAVVADRLRILLDL